MAEEIYSVSTLKDFDIFFYYGKNDLETETKSDLLANIIQTKRSLFYDRALDSAGAGDFENVPEGLALRINLPYDIVNSLAKRNQFVTDGQNDSRDRRVAVSQSLISVEGQNNGNINVSVSYRSMSNFKQTESIQINLGG